MKRKTENRIAGVGVVVGSIMLVISIIVLSRASFGQEVSSVRDSQYEWQCETEAGVLISGHTRLDKAFQSCMNLALVDGQLYIVRGGTYRVTATGGQLPPPVEPPPEPPVEPPPVEPPPDSPQVTFGPVSALLSYDAAISALKQNEFRWEITFTLTDVIGVQGLASRDQSGQAESGHLSVWVDNGQVIVRHQDIAGGHPSARLVSSSTVEAGREYKLTISVSVTHGIGLFFDGVLQDSDPWAVGTTGNNLPLIVGGLCTRCSADGLVGPDRPIKGTVYLEIWDDPLDLPVPVVGSTMLNWTTPTENVNNEPLPPGIPDRISVYELNPRTLTATLDGESIIYEVTALAGGEHCFAVTAWHQPTESRDSNTVCKVIQ